MTQRCVTVCFMVLSIAATAFAQEVSQQKTLIFREALKSMEKRNPEFKPQQTVQLDSVQMTDLGFEQVYTSQPKQFVMRDDINLFTNHYSYESNRAIILIHGVGASSYTYTKMAGLLREAAEAEVYSIDLRGYGLSQGEPGDVKYTNQYVDDIADIIFHIKEKQPEQ